MRDVVPGQDNPFGGRLRRLRERAGLTQEELASRAGLSARAISDLERGERKRPYPHTVRALADALVLPEDERASLLASVPKRGGAAAAPSTTTTVPALTMPPTSLVGRERDVAAVRSLLDGAGKRLVTLTGPGGVGKTRLALEAANEVAERFPDGVAFVALAPVSAPDLLAPSVARALGLREASVKPVRELVHGYLGEKHLLLVLDNFEHLIEAAPEVAALLAAGPSTKVLVTSRAPLRLRGEQEYPVAPLAVPDPTRVPDAEDVTASPAAELFVERAQEANPSFLLTRKNAAAVAAICWRLDGLPLALELVAARARFLVPTELLPRLDQALEAGGARDLPERQRTMRSTLDWSHDLLSEPERALFRRLSVFAGGFALEAAEEVANGEDVLVLLGQLAEQSLIKAEPREDETRYRMLEPIRQYALEKLRESEEEERARERHARHHEALALRAERGLRGAGQVEWMGRLGREHDNLRTAMCWLLDRGDAGRVVGIGWNVWWFWFVRGFLAEGKQWMERALESDARLSVICRAKALT
ncbi:MAG: helix-turn-helix domain-containing protein, partial [Actinomycetota bacterium]|nr:helix-turn-helix domain-containing protein [Actinomycetota bacterium]